MDVSAAILRQQGVQVSTVRAVDYDIAPGVEPDMREHGFEQDGWPKLWRQVARAHILVIGTPIWLGERSSVCSRVIERLYAHSSELDDRGQYVFYGKVAGCIVTGNEDGVKHCAAGILYSMQHIGCLIPPQADAGWIGDIGPGPSYLDEESGGPENDFTQRNTTFMSWNLMHLAAILRDAGGIPVHGNLPAAWTAGERFGHPGASRTRP